MQFKCIDIPRGEGGGFFDLQITFKISRFILKEQVYINV